MVDLAVRGYLRIVEKEKPKFFGLVKDHEYVFERLDPPADAKPLAAHEERVLAGIFEDGQNVELSDLENDFIVTSPGSGTASFQADRARTVSVAARPGAHNLDRGGCVVGSGHHDAGCHRWRRTVQPGGLFQSP
jgi:hypothetical protein